MKRDSILGMALLTYFMRLSVKAYTNGNWRRIMNRRFVLHLSALLLGASLIAPFSMAQQVIKLSTTISTEDSGLLSYLLPIFEAKTNSKVQAISVGTGKALELAKNGDVDVTLVHARQSEDKFVAEGYGINRRDVMYNDFIIVGTDSDPAGIKGGKDVQAAMKKMSMAGELEAYTLTDRATYSVNKAKTGLVIAVEGDPKMFNPYGIIAVNPAKHKDVNYKGAMQLVDWITSEEGQKAIATFEVEGQQVFFPSAKAK
jgi:tungstate transport system substrate-binding protein